MLTIDMVYIVDADLVVHAFFPSVWQLISYTVRKRLGFGVSVQNKMKTSVRPSPIQSANVWGLVYLYKTK